MASTRLELSDLAPYARAQAERQLATARCVREVVPVERPKVKADAPKSELEEAFVTLRKQLAPWLPEPARGHVFAAVASEVTRPRKWAFDFAWVAEKVAVEVEGGVFTQGRHTRGRGFTEDAWKYGTATALGWAILRCTGGMLAKEPERFLRLVSFTVAARRAR